MNLKYLNWLFIGLLFFTISCEKDEDDEELIGNWIERSEFDGDARSMAVAFSIGKYGYMGTGYDGTDRLSDFWVYDTEQNYWTQIADYPGGTINSAVAFTVNGKGYVGTGYDGIDKRNDFYEYNPSTQEWTEKTSFPGSERYGSSTFAIGDTGYLTCGYDGGYLKDFWKYNAVTDTWELGISMGGSKRRDAVAFAIDGRGYICTGISNGEYESDLWEYNPSIGLWTEKREIADISDDDYDDDYDIVRSDAVAFVINNKAYITTGTSGSLRADVWEYEPLSDLWERKTNFEGTSRTDAVAFSVDDDSRGYVFSGRNSSYQFEDIWEFKPDDEYDDED